MPAGTVEQVAKPECGVKMATLGEIKAQIERCNREKLGALYYPRLFFVGRIAGKTHLGRVFLDINKAGRLVLFDSFAGCGSQRWGDSLPQVAQMTGIVQVTCKRCGEGLRNLDEMNAAMLEIIPFIGKHVE